MSEHPYDDLPGLLFGELDRAQVTAVSDHLATCDDCRCELAVLAATSASLRATARDAQALPEAAPGVAAAEGAPAVGPHRVGRSTARPGRRRRPLIGLAAALALALVAAAVLLWTGPLRPDRSGGTVPLAGVGAVAASGQASMAGDDGDRRMTVTTDDLPALRPGQYYEVWLLDPKAGTVFPVGVLPPTARPASPSPPRWSAATRQSTSASRPTTATPPTPSTASCEAATPDPPGPR